MADMTRGRTAVAQYVRLLLRGFGIFLLLSLLCVLLYWFCLHHHSNVAVWSGTVSPREAVVYEGKTYHLAAELGSPGVSKTKFKQGDLLGEVKPEGKGARQAAVKVYALANSDKFSCKNYLMLIYEDETCYIYYMEGVENPYTGTDTEKETVSQTP